MRIYVKEKNKRVFIPIPFWFLKIFINEKMKKFIIKNTRDNKYIDYIKEINFDEVYKTLKRLKAYKGLKIVDVESENGEKVKITI